ncbi:MAG: SpoVG family protein [bacterium]
MEITSVKIFKTEREGSKVKAYATVTLDDCFMVHNIKVIEGAEKLVVAMPSRKLADDRYEDVAHPLNSETRTMFEDKILAEYNTAE